MQGASVEPENQMYTKIITIHCNSCSLAPNTCRCILLSDPDGVEQDAVAQEDPPAEVPSSKPEEPEFTTTIYTETVQFLLQNSALQVKEHLVIDKSAQLILVAYT